MKKLDLNQAIQTLANFGVIGGLIFLGLEVSQNNSTVRSQTRSQHTESVVQMLRFNADPESAAILMKGADNYSSLTELEKRRFLSIAIATYRVYENSHYQYRMGLLDEMEFDGEKNSWRLQVERNEGMRISWCLFRGSFSPFFREEIDGMLSRPCEDGPTLGR